MTRYELSWQLDKVSKITGLAKDLALFFVCRQCCEWLSHPGIKSVIGLELPNPHRELVGLQEVIDSKTYRKSESHSP